MCIRDSVIAIQRGTTDPNRYVIMSGDIDSRVSDVMDATSDSPGANDNASGVAGALEAARVLSKQRFHGSIVYAALGGEEQGLYGGRILAEHAKANGWRIVGVLNNDMIGNSSGIDGITDRHTARVFSEGTRADEMCIRDSAMAARSRLNPRLTKAPRSASLCRRCWIIRLLHLLPTPDPCRGHR